MQLICSILSFCSYYQKLHFVNDLQCNKKNHWTIKSLSMMQATKERYNNRGAYIVLEPPDFATPVFHSFDAITPRPKVFE